MPLAQLPLTGRPHRNQQLFSDHYLDAVLPALPEWKLRAGDALHLLEKIRRIYSDFVPGNNEAQTEQGFIRPVLQALGHSFEVQPALHTPGNVKRPDYIFYRDAAALAANMNAVLNDANLSGALATSPFICSTRGCRGASSPTGVAGGSSQRHRPQVAHAQ